jgi:membrane-associated protease RseP (regulator of RpoE activity)
LGIRGLDAIEIVPNSPAAKAGLVVHDRIIEFAGQKIETFEQLTAEIGKCDAGDTVDVKFIRGTETRDAKVTFDAWGDDLGAPAGSAERSARGAGVVRPHSPRGSRWAPAAPADRATAAGSSPRESAPTGRSGVASLGGASLNGERRFDLAFQLGQVAAGAELMGEQLAALLGPDADGAEFALRLRAKKCDLLRREGPESRRRPPCA